MCHNLQCFCAYVVHNRYISSYLFKLYYTVSHRFAYECIQLDQLTRKLSEGWNWLSY